MMAASDTGRRRVILARSDRTAVAVGANIVEDTHGSSPSSALSFTASLLKIVAAKSR